MIKFQSKKEMIEKLSKKGFNVIENNIFYKNEFAGTWELDTETNNKKNKFPVKVEFIRKYQEE